MESIPDSVERLRGVRYTDITQQRMIVLLLNMYETITELQDRVRILENDNDSTNLRLHDLETYADGRTIGILPDSTVIPKVKLNNGANNIINDTYSLDKKTQ